MEDICKMAFLVRFGSAYTVTSGVHGGSLHVLALPGVPLWCMLSVWCSLDWPCSLLLDLTWTTLAVTEMDGTTSEEFVK